MITRKKDDFIYIIMFFILFIYTRGVGTLRPCRNTTDLLVIVTGGGGREAQQQQRRAKQTDLCGGRWGRERIFF